MIIAIWMILTKVVFPELVNLLLTLMNDVMPIVIMIIFISILVSAVGQRLNISFMGTIFNAMIGAIGYLGRTFISAIGWILRHLLLFIPVFYRGIRKNCISGGMSHIAANVVATIGTIIFVAVVI